MTEKHPGRPKKPINWDQFEQLCGLQCTQSEIASMFHVDTDTICTRVRDHYGDNYSDVYKRFSESGKNSLRRNQFVLSKKNASMAIWLGKIWLGQKDPGLEEVKGDVLDVVREAVRAINHDARVQGPGKPVVADEQPILDKECTRTTPEV